MLSILRAAKTPGPTKYNFAAAGASEPNAFEQLIDDEILVDMGAHNSSFAPPGVQMQQQQHHQQADGGQQPYL